MKWVEKAAKTVEEAVELALQELNTTRDKANIEVLEQPNKGFLGLIGSRLAKVKVSVVEEKAAVAEVAVKEKVESRDKEKDAAYKFLREVLNCMDIKAEIKIKDTEKGLYIEILGPKMGIIIGRRGQTLDALQYLVSLVVNKNKGREEYVRVVVDTENYRQKREDTLIRLANRLAERVVRSRQKMELEPMNPYERRIIHSALQDYPGVITYSEGEEPNRKVIIACK